MNCKHVYTANPDRYAEGVMNYRRCGTSGIRLPEISLGFWWHYGEINVYGEAREKVLYAFDHGITCFDLANNYGPPYGSAEETFGKIYGENLRSHRHEMIVTTKAGYDMWPGPYGIGSSRKMLMTSIDESLHRMRLDYVDIFYSHRYDGFTPIEETMQALVDIVRSGKALYVGLSNYPADKLAEAAEYLSARDVHPLIYQGKYNMLRARHRGETHRPARQVGHRPDGIFPTCRRAAYRQIHWRQLPRRFPCRTRPPLEAECNHTAVACPYKSIKLRGSTTRAISCTNGSGMVAVATTHDLGNNRTSHGRTACRQPASLARHLFLGRRNN